MRVHAKPGIGEFGHVGAADDGRIRQRGDAPHHGVALGRGGIVQNARSGACHLAGDVEQILTDNVTPAKGGRAAPPARSRRYGLPGAAASLFTVIPRGGHLAVGGGKAAFEWSRAARVPAASASAVMKSIWTCDDYGARQVKSKTEKHANSARKIGLKGDSGMRGRRGA